MRAVRIFIGAYLTFLFIICLQIFGYLDPKKTDVSKLNALQYKVNCHHDVMCSFENLCLSNRYGLFVISESPAPSFPPIFPGAVPLEPWIFKISPQIIHPSSLTSKELVFFVDKALLVAGTFSPSHLSHMLVNSIVPIHQTFTTSTSLSPFSSFDLLSVGRYQDPAEMLFAFLPSYLPIENYYTTSHFPVPGSPNRPYNPLAIKDGITLARNVLPRDKIFCYSTGVIGINQTCALCQNHPSFETYESLRKLVLSHYGISEEPLPKRILVVQRKKGRRILNMEEVLGLLDRRGADYRHLELEGMEFKEQVKAFAEAKIAILPHGNGNAHIHWMHQSAVIVEALNAFGYGENFYSTISQQKKMIHEKLFCDAPQCEELKNKPEKKQQKKLEEGQEKDHVKEGDIYITISKLEALLNKHL